MRRSFVWVSAGLLMLASPGRAQLPDGPSVQAFILGDALSTVADVDAPDGFKLGQIVAHANAALSEHLVFFGELSITAVTAPRRPRTPCGSMHPSRARFPMRY